MSERPQASVVMDSLLLGGTYDRPELAKLWGYQDWHAIGRDSGRVRTCWSVPD